MPNCALLIFVNMSLADTQSFYVCGKMGTAGKDISKGNSTPLTIRHPTANTTTVTNDGVGAIYAYRIVSVWP